MGDCLSIQVLYWYHFLQGFSFIKIIDWRVKKKKQSTAFSGQRMLHCTSTNHQIMMCQVSDLFTARLPQVLLMISVILPWSELTSLSKVRKKTSWAIYGLPWWANAKTIRWHHHFAKRLDCWNRNFRWVDFKERVLLLAVYDFSITRYFLSNLALTKGATFKIPVSDGSEKFQSTLPRRQRLRQLWDSMTWQNISIHALAKGATF